MSGQHPYQDIRSMRKERATWTEEVRGASRKRSGRASRAAMVISRSKNSKRTGKEAGSSSLPQT